MSFKDDLVDRARKNRALKYIYLKIFSPYVDLHIKELSLRLEPWPSSYRQPRLNLLLPSLNRQHVFGGAATALDFFNLIAARGGYSRRIIAVNVQPDRRETAENFADYRIVSGREDSSAERQILSAAQGILSVPVGERDLFMATTWWTAICAQKINEWQAARCSERPGALLYLIQDYEPGFYPWSSEYLLAESTYKYPGRQIALFNTQSLQKYFHQRGYRFERELCFEPGINETLLKYKRELNLSAKKKQIVVYGRPSAPRNAFALLHEALKVWAGIQPEASQWQLISVGEKHRDLDLGHGVRLLSRGKLPLAEYARLLAESSVGLSFMVSPHPSYPPLEMAEFGLHVITNSFHGKDLSSYYENIISLQRCLPDDIARALLDAALKQPLNRAGVRLPAIEQPPAYDLITEIVGSLAGSGEEGNNNSKYSQ